MCAGGCSPTSFSKTVPNYSKLCSFSFAAVQKSHFIRNCTHRLIACEDSDRYTKWKIPAILNYPLIFKRHLQAWTPQLGAMSRLPLFCLLVASRPCNCLFRSCWLSSEKHCCSQYNCRGWKKTVFIFFPPTEPFIGQTQLFEMRRNSKCDYIFRLEMVRSYFLCNWCCDVRLCKYFINVRYSGLALQPHSKKRVFIFAPPCVCVGSLRFLQLSPTIQKHGYEVNWELYSPWVSELLFWLNHRLSGRNSFPIQITSFFQEMNPDECRNYV